ncbi:hypothetical protein HB949_01615 [Listeria welshimeri]|nr:hypothetical protein [Listeria welshimeri]
MNIDLTKYNCFEITLSNILSRQDIDIRNIWGQLSFGLSYEEGYPIIEDGYSELVPFLEDNFPITIEKKFFDSNEIDRIIDLFKKKDNYYVVKVDTFELEYSVYYQREHYIHMVEILDTGSEGLFNIKDHYFSTEATIKEKSLKKAIISVKNNLEDLFSKTDIEILIIKPNGKKEGFKPSIILRDSISALNGSNRFVNEPNKIGIDYILELKNILVNPNINYNFYSTQLNDLGNSRYHFSLFLESNFDENFMGVSNDYYLLSLEWNTIYNLFMYMSLKKNKEKFLENILIRIDKVYILEKKSLQKLIELKEVINMEDKQCM